MTVELRCLAKKHGELDDFNVLEVKCNSKFCGAEPGIIILHRFSTVTGKLLSTEKFKDPMTRSN